MKRTLMSTLVTIMMTAAAQASPIYNPVGPQTNVPLATVTGGGWTQCYAATMATTIGNAGENVLNLCVGDLLMMAGRVTNTNRFLVLAEAPRADTIFDTGNTSVTHLANGSNWWYSDFWSWGFTAAGDTVENNECDVSDSPTSMCLHTLASTGGFRINNIYGLNDSVDYEKVFFVASDGAAVPEPASILLLGTGVAGIAVRRWRRARVNQ
jgi:hypothetical protein